MWMRASPNFRQQMWAPLAQNPPFLHKMCTVVVRLLFRFFEERFPLLFFLCAFGKKLGREFFETRTRKHSGIDRIENNREGHGMGRRDGFMQHGERKKTPDHQKSVIPKALGCTHHIVLTSCHELIYYKQTRNCNTSSSIECVLYAASM